MAQAFFDARATAFPFDGADDPSFYCARHFDAPVTWGVCRTDVRNQVQPGDWVAFFSGERDSEGQDVDYRFVGVLRVAAKHSGWNPPEQFQGYLNRLVAPQGGQWVHAEPALSPSEWHVDWLWRLSGAGSGRKDELVRLSQKGAVSDAFAAAPDADGQNYIEFARDDGFVLAAPPLVARKTDDALQEAWLGSRNVLALREVIFGAEAERWLRTTNRQQPHRHVRRDLGDDLAWAELVRQAAEAIH